MVRLGARACIAGGLATLILATGSARASSTAGPYRSAATLEYTTGSVATAHASASADGRLKAVAESHQSSSELGDSALAEAAAAVQTRAVHASTGRVRGIVRIHGIGSASVDTTLGKASSEVWISVLICTRRHPCSAPRPPYPGYQTTAPSGATDSPAGESGGPLPYSAMSGGDEDNFDIPFKAAFGTGRRCIPDTYWIQVVITSEAASSTLSASRAEADYVLDSVSFEDVPC